MKEIKAKPLGILHLEQFFKKIKLIGKVILMLLLSQKAVQAQKNITKQQLIWYGYYNILNINDNWNLKSEIQERQFVKPTAQHQLVFRTNLERKLIDKWNSSVGLTFFLQSSHNPNSESKQVIPELRPDVGISNKQKVSFFTILQRYKLEARFFNVLKDDHRTNEYKFSNFRFRYQLGLDFLLFEKEKSDKVILKIKDEVMLNVGKKIVKNTFDQNRIYLGLNYVINPSISVEIGYMNWFQQQSSSVDFYNRDIVRFSLFHKLSFKNNKHE
ncbi:DUF2490 domain-containing protein [Flavobacterium sp. 316]|uniref:DUF2490 domain-containing protein n=1 Tax=Flavobacterium sp. 316 TaxID=1603293 RepID=UPI0005FA8B9C|nr:DUF2490 domain-containing protein [Flavobacterium sp. 316]